MRLISYNEYNNDLKTPQIIGKSVYFTGREIDVLEVQLPLRTFPACISFDEPIMKRTILCT